MNATIPVSEIYPYLETMLKDKWGYIYGAAGIMWTQEKQNLLENTKGDDSNYSMSVKYGSKWIGHMVIDCSGVPYYIFKKFNVSIPHGSNSIAKKGYVGKMTKTPAPGYAAFKYRSEGDDYHHIGIVYKDGKTVYEARGTVAGFTTSDVSTWDYFAPFSQVIYNETEEAVKPMDTPYLAEITGDNVRIRTGPGTTYKTFGNNLYKGDRVKVITTTGNWCFCDILGQDGVQGYVFSKYVAEIVDEALPFEPVEYDRLKELYKQADDLAMSLKNLIEELGGEV